MVNDESTQFDARDYWSRRLADEWSLRGTGHICYSAGYNRWLYRAKRRVITRALRNVQAGASLDVGSGVGWVVRLLLDGGWSVQGCDITELSVERLTSEFPGVQFDVVDAGHQPLPAADASVDLVTVIDVAFHLVEDEQIERLTSEIHRVLRPGGRALLTDTLGRSDERPDPHVRFRGRETWDRALAESSLRITDVLPYFRFLSRLPSETRLLRPLPGRVRGAVEYAADLVVPAPPHMRLAVVQHHD